MPCVVSAQPPKKIHYGKPIKFTVECDNAEVIGHICDKDILVEAIATLCDKEGKTLGYYGDGEKIGLIGLGNNDVKGCEEKGTWGLRFPFTKLLIHRTSDTTPGEWYTLRVHLMFYHIDDYNREHGVDCKVNTTTEAFQLRDPDLCKFCCLSGDCCWLIKIQLIGWTYLEDEL